MIFDENVAEMARADRSNALLIAAINELSRPYELDELTRVMREFLPAQDLEAIRGIAQDWIARGRPCVGIDDSFLSHVDFAVRKLDRITRGRIAHRCKYAEDSAQRQQHEAFALGRRLLSLPYAFISVFGPDHASEGAEGNAPPAVVDETSSPASLLERLESTATGCRCLLEGWTRDFRGFLEPDLGWATDDGFKIIPLMGKCPRDVLENSELVDVFLASHEIDRRGRNPFMALRGQVSLAEVTDLLRRLGPRVKSTPDPGDAQQGRQTLITIVESAMAGLTAKAEEQEQRSKTTSSQRAGGVRYFAPRTRPRAGANVFEEIIKETVRTLRKVSASASELK